MRVLESFCISLGLLMNPCFPPPYPNSAWWGLKTYFKTPKIGATSASTTLGAKNPFAYIWELVNAI
jgi:hypothetical protein